MEVAICTSKLIRTGNNSVYTLSNAAGAEYKMTAAELKAAIIKGSMMVENLIVSKQNRLCVTDRKTVDVTRENSRFGEYTRNCNLAKMYADEFISGISSKLLDGMAIIEQLELVNKKTLKEAGKVLGYQFEYCAKTGLYIDCSSCIHVLGKSLYNPNNFQPMVADVVINVYEKGKALSSIQVTSDIVSDHPQFSSSEYLGRLKFSKTTKLKQIGRYSEACSNHLIWMKEALL